MLRKVSRLLFAGFLSCVGTDWLLAGPGWPQLRWLVPASHPPAGWPGVSWWSRGPGERAAATRPREAWAWNQQLSCPPWSVGQSRSQAREGSGVGKWGPSPDGKQGSGCGSRKPSVLSVCPSSLLLKTPRARCHFPEALADPTPPHPEVTSPPATSSPPACGSLDPEHPVKGRPGFPCRRGPLLPGVPEKMLGKPAHHALSPARARRRGSFLLLNFPPRQADSSSLLFLPAPPSSSA